MKQDEQAKETTYRILAVFALSLLLLVRGCWVIERMPEEGRERVSESVGR